MRCADVDHGQRTPQAAGCAEAAGGVCAGKQRSGLGPMGDASSGAEGSPTCEGVLDIGLRGVGDRRLSAGLGRCAGAMDVRGWRHRKLKALAKAPQPLGGGVQQSRSALATCRVSVRVRNLGDVHGSVVAGNNGYGSTQTQAYSHVGSTHLGRSRHVGASRAQFCQAAEQWEKSSLPGRRQQGVYYYFYQIFRNKAEATALERKRNGFGDGSVGMLSSLVVAAMAGCVNVLLTNPIWVVVTRMQTHTKKSQPNSTGLLSPEDVIPSAVEPPPFGTSLAIQEVYGEGGVLGFWRGVLPTLIMVSNPSIQFMLYETLLKKLKKRRLSSNKGNSNVTAFEIFLLGAMAKLGATVVTYPLLVVKSRLQAKQIVADKRHQYRGTLDAILKMIRYEGCYGFYKGMSTKIVQSVLAAAVLFMVKEELVKGSRWLLASDPVKLKQR
ncbi:hypothetical protein SASPL_101530 [Salvia splendens]|uniref:Solute carrier family 25 (Peroxisomal adenine nucleotide transporter), member 17 n=1 Tax=Salvia splendens TaxID=180675 RepID=A0A8X8YPF6_SALSN|nr:hypothetical protein SASPL_101530 [Salvia splendens]